MFIIVFTVSLMWTGTDQEIHLHAITTSTEQMLVILSSSVNTAVILFYILKGFILIFDLSDEDAFYQSRYYLEEIESVSNFICNSVCKLTGLLSHKSKYHDCIP